VLVGYAEVLGAAKAAAIQSGGDINPNQELVAHGPANILSGLFGGFLVVGSLSKTSVAIAAGARSQVANLIAAAFCFFTLILLNRSRSASLLHHNHGNRPQGSPATQSPRGLRQLARTRRGKRPPTTSAGSAINKCATWSIARQLQAFPDG